MKIELLRLPGRARLRQIAVGGTASIVVGVVATNLLRIVSSMTLTRLLDTHAFGVVGVITSVAYVLTMLSDVGLYDFVVRHKEGDDPRFLDQLWTIRLVRGVGLTLMMFVIARPAAALLGKPELGLVIAVWSISFLIDGLSSMSFAVAPRKQWLWRLSMMELIASVCALIVSVIAAVVTHSYWALIMGMTVGSLVKTAMSYVLFPGSVRRWTFSIARSRELWLFSRYIAVSSILSLFVYQADKLVLARLMPLSTYGLYAIATTLAVAPAVIAAQYCTRVLYSIYSHAVRTDPSALARVFYAARRKVALLYMFGAGVFIGVAPLIVEILYDPRYRGATPFLQWLAIGTLLQMPTLAAKQATLALGDTRLTLVATLARIVWLAIGGGIGLATGHIMLVVAAVGTMETAGLAAYLWKLHRARILKVREEAYGFIVGLAGACIGWAFAQAGLALIARLF